MGAEKRRWEKYFDLSGKYRWSKSSQLSMDGRASVSTCRGGQTHSNAETKGTWECGPYLRTLQFPLRILCLIVFSCSSFMYGMPFLRNWRREQNEMTSEGCLRARQQSKGDTLASCRQGRRDREHSEDPSPVTAPSSSRFIPCYSRSHTDSKTEH